MAVSTGVVIIGGAGLFAANGTGVAGATAGGTGVLSGLAAKAGRLLRRLAGLFHR